MQRRRHHSCPADRCQGCSENNHCQRLKVDSKELGGCGHFVDKAKSCWPLLPLCPPLLLFVLLMLLHHHLYNVSTASHVTGVLSANNQRLIILPQHLVLPRHASALLLCVFARGPVRGYSMFFSKPQIASNWLQGSFCHMLIKADACFAALSFFLLRGLSAFETPLGYWICSSRPGHRT